LTQIVASQTLALDKHMGKISGGHNLCLSLGVGRGRRMKMNEGIRIFYLCYASFDEAGEN
jgi:hypothetical protein